MALKRRSFHIDKAELDELEAFYLPLGTPINRVIRALVSRHLDRLRAKAGDYINEAEIRKQEAQEFASDNRRTL